MVILLRWESIKTKSWCPIKKLYRDGGTIVVLYTGHHDGQPEITSCTEHSMSTSTTTRSVDMPDGFEGRLRRRANVQNNPLSTIPVNELHKPHGNIPNTPLTASTISFLLGAVFSLASLACLMGAWGFLSWPYFQLGFFVAAWAIFHWGEFAVTAGWNLDKCSVDCKGFLVISS